MTQPDIAAPDGATPAVATSDGATIERVLRPLARKAGGMTGADIREVVQHARRKARREKRAVTYDDIETLLVGSRPMRSAKLCWRMAVHEAGHAIARLYFQLGEIIEITIDAPDGGYAPVKNPEYKAVGERIFRTVNEECVHRLPGACPYKTEMSEPEFEPRAEDLFSLEEIHERVWLFIITQYHTEVHEGIDMQPARAWDRGVERGEWHTVDDITAASKFLGQIERRTLDATGVHVWGHRFHDQAAVSALLDSLLRYTAGRRRREKRLASGTVPVIVTLDPTTCEYVHVWDYAKRRNVKLYNTDRRFAKNCSWRLAKAIRKTAAEENRAFLTDEEMWEARRIYEASLVPAITGSPLREQRKLLRQLKRPKSGLAMGNTVQTVEVTPSVSGMNSTGIPNALPASMRDDDRVPPKGPRRGRAKAGVAKSPKKTQPKVTTTRKDTPASGSVAAIAAPATRGPGNVVPYLQDVEAQALLAKLAADLD